MILRDAAPYEILVSGLLVASLSRKGSLYLGFDSSFGTADFEQSTPPQAGTLMQVDLSDLKSPLRRERERERDGGPSDHMASNPLNTFSRLPFGFRVGLGFRV